MPINITNLINQIETRASAADSSTDTKSLLNLIRLVQDYNQYNFKTVEKPFELPSADSSTIGDVYFVRDKIYDSFGSFYLGQADGWTRFTLHADSDEDSDYAAYLSSLAGGGGGAAAAGWSFQGSSYGYASGGTTPTTPGGINIIQKYSFVTDGDTSPVGTLTVGRGYTAGQSSPEHGYTVGGFPNRNVVDKFPFAADGAASDVGDINPAKFALAGQHNETTGYASGGVNNSNNVVDYNVIDKFPFAADANITSYGGTLTVARRYVTGTSSATHGYTSQGLPSSNVIDKFSFASEGNATDVGDAVFAGYSGGGVGVSSTTDGFLAGGSPNNFMIQKFSFVSDGNAANVGSLTSPPGYLGINGNVGTSAVDYGYFHGGSYANQYVQKFPYAISSGTSSSVGNQASPTELSSGQQI